MPLNVDRESKIIEEIWGKREVLKPPEKFIAIYNQGNDKVYEKYAVINDDPIKNYIYLGSIVKSNKRKQIFIVNKIHIINNDIKDDNYYEFKPVIFSNGGGEGKQPDIYGSPIMPLKCSGPKMMETIKDDLQRFVITEILSHPDLTDFLLCGDMKD